MYTGKQPYNHLPAINFKVLAFRGSVGSMTRRPLHLPVFHLFTSLTLSQASHTSLCRALSSFDGRNKLIDARGPTSVGRVAAS